ncbi:hypothetical protein K2X33_09655, partial [bacterium]|nr:hypothetical protein [bacterium]
AILRDEGEERRQALFQRIAKVRAVLSQGGVPLAPVRGEWGPLSPILSLPLAGNDRALRFAQSMRNSGWDLRAIRYPTVAKGSERIRLSVGLGPTEQQTEQMARELVKQWTAFS